MLSQVNYYLYNMDTLYTQNNTNLAQTMQQMASGKKFQTPSEDSVAYFRTQSLNEQNSQYSTIKSNLGEWQNAMNIASTASGEVYTKLLRMKDLTNGYASADATTQAAYTTQYNQLNADITQIVGQTSYNGNSLLNVASGGNGIAKVDLVPNATADTQRLVIDPGEAVKAADLTALTPGGGVKISAMTAAVNTAIGDTQSYITNVGGYQASITSHANITDSIMSNTQSSSDLLSNIDDAQEMVDYTQESIRQQASAAMISQANLAQKNVLMLYQFGH